METAKGRRWWAGRNGTHDPGVRCPVGTEMTIARGMHAVASKRGALKRVASEGLSLWRTLEMIKLIGLVADGDGTCRGVAYRPWW